MQPLLLVVVLSVATCGEAYGTIFVHQTNRFAYGPTSSSLPQSLSTTECAASCERDSSTCEGFSLAANGSCQHFSDTCASQTAAQEVDRVSYVQHAIAHDGSAVSPCASGWYLFKNSCYYRGQLTEQKNEYEMREVCWQQNACSDLVSVNDELELYYVYTHGSRPDAAEYIGLKNGQDNVLVNIDGSTISFQPNINNGHPDPNQCLSAVNGKREKLFPRSCTSRIAGYVCEAPTRCRAGLPCPAGWIAVDNYCYYYTTQSNSWSDADTYCQNLQSGARLSSITNTETWKIIKKAFTINENVWVGISDSSGGGSYYAVDGSSWSLTWNPGEPSSSSERCVEMLTVDKANDATCSRSQPHLCRVPVTDC